MIHLMEVQKKFKKNKEFIDQIKNGRIDFYPDFYCLGFTQRSVLGIPIGNKTNKIINGLRIDNPID